MNNIIFLDIDGVLNDNSSSFSLESVNVLKYLIKIYNTKVVMITSWQMNGTENKRKNIKYKFEKLGIYDIDFIDPNFEGCLGNIILPSRLLGIVDYLRKYPEYNYVIFDDDYHNDYKLLCLNYYKTNAYKGLNYGDLKKIEFRPVNLNNFKCINYYYRQLGEYELITNKLIKVLKKKYENDIK